MLCARSAFHVEQRIIIIYAKRQKSSQLVVIVAFIINILIIKCRV